MKWTDIPDDTKQKLLGIQVETFGDKLVNNPIAENVNS